MSSVCTIAYPIRPHFLVPFKLSLVRSSRGHHSFLLSSVNFVYVPSTNQNSLNLTRSGILLCSGFHAKLEHTFVLYVYILGCYWALVDTCKSFGEFVVAH